MILNACHPGRNADHFTMFCLVPIVMGTRVLFLGDSTVRHQFHVFCGNAPSRAADKGTQQIVCERNGISAVMPAHHLGGPGAKGGYSDWALSNVKSGLFKDFEATQEALMDSIVDITGINFTHVYFNGGLHALHIEPERRWRYEEWRNAETLVTGFISALKRHFEDIAVIYMTSHHVCTAKFTPREKAAMKNGAKSCTLPQFPLWAVEPQCREGLMDNNGIRALNIRTLRALPAGVTVNDCYSITAGWCNATRDGVHYAKHVIEREVRSLLELLR